MAYRETVKNEDLKNYLNGANHFWNISESVGWGCANNWADVMLVQFMLSAAWRLNDVPCDGAFGPKTAAAIKHFQKYCRDRIKVDGTLHKVDGTRLRSTISKTIYTILEMNAELTRYLPITFNDLGGNPELPAALRTELFGDSGSRKSGLRGHPQTIVN